MNSIFFLVTHFGSGYPLLIDALNDNPRIQLLDSNVNYMSAEDVIALSSMPHKCRNTAATQGDVLLQDRQFAALSAHSFCKFIFLIREPRGTLSEINSKEGLIYYRRRLRRICEMAKKSPDSIFLRYDDLGKNLKSIEEFLNLSKPLKAIKLPDIVEANLDYEILTDAEDAYESCLYYLNAIYKSVAQ